MVFIYKTETGVVISERPFGQTKKLGWEMLESFSTKESAVIRARRYYPDFTLDSVAPKQFTKADRAKHRKEVLTRRKNAAAALKQRLRMMGHKRYNDPHATYRSRAKNSANKALSWRNQPDTYFVLRPDGKSMRVYLPEGKEHAILPKGWRFGRDKSAWDRQRNKKRKRKPPTES